MHGVDRLFDRTCGRFFLHHGRSNWESVHHPRISMHSYWRQRCWGYQRYHGRRCFICFILPLSYPRHVSTSARVLFVCICDHTNLRDISIILTRRLAVDVRLSIDWVRFSSRTGHCIYLFLQKIKTTSIHGYFQYFWAREISIKRTTFQFSRLIRRYLLDDAVCFMNVKCSSSRLGHKVS